MQHLNNPFDASNARCTGCARGLLAPLGTPGRDSTASQMEKLKVPVHDIASGCLS